MSNQQLHLLQWIEYGKCMKMLVNGNLSGMVYLKKFSVVGRTGVFFRAWAVSIKNLCWLMRSSRDLLPINTLWWSNIASCEIPELNGGKTFVRGGSYYLQSTTGILVPIDQPDITSIMFGWDWSILHGSFVKGWERGWKWYEKHNFKI